MSKRDQFKLKLGSNIQESIGKRDGAATTGTTPTPSKIIKKNEGLRRDANFGEMAINRITCEAQPREEFTKEQITALAQSIKKHGQLSPIRVRWSDDKEQWVVISGERRFRASKQAGLKTVRCYFVDSELTESQILEEQIVENLHRQDLSPMEQAKAYQQLMDINSWTAKQLGDHLHLAKSTLSECLSLLKLPDPIQEKVDTGKIPRTAATELVKVKDKRKQQEMADDIASGKVTREETRKKTTRGIKAAGKKKRTTTNITFKSTNGIKVLLSANKKTTFEEQETALQHALDELVKQREALKAAA